MTDFFISYTSADKTWAEWIAFTLEEKGYKTIVQAWDFRPGSNFVLEMQKAATEADRTIMVLSPDYLKSQFATPEWAAAFTRDPKSLGRKLVPVMVRDCQPPGLLSPIVHISLIGLDEDEAQAQLLKGVNAERSKPTNRPSFPGAKALQSHASFPGPAAPSSGGSQSPYLPKVKRAATDVERRRFGRQTFDTIKRHFETALNELQRQDAVLECDFQAITATEFTAEVFLNGKSVCRCKIWQGGTLAADGISFAEGHWFHGNGGTNEILSISDGQGDLRLSSLMGGITGRQLKQYDLKNLNPEQAADYLWRRFVEPLER
ncbi:toll/interleukin-1 receptor domain-containing protein [Labrys portucalensis]|uniref:Toll/interleukin-1 receptor domain-containing protein n=1 Tax=Labrys neptuniae TaxID=376174 RepID=A0ABV6ZRE8_9HYPH